ncbi:MAG: CocE/NonD family hydrolase [Terriglobia bacterium]
MKLRWIAPVLMVIAGFVVFGAIGRSSAQDAPDYSQIFEKKDVMIPMRDGVRLHTEIYIPKDAKGPLPFLIERTPYGIPADAKGFTHKLALYREMIPDGYIFVFQDIRGRYKSEGQFVMLKPPRDPKDPKAIDEGTDTYDTIDWLLKNVPNNNGRAGIVGISYGGWLTVMAALDPHPALKAASEQASPADMFLGDDFHHNGAFRLSYGFEYSSRMETSKGQAFFGFDRWDTFEWYLRLGPLSNVDALYLHHKIPTWDDFVNHPNYDNFWQRQAVTPYLTSVKVPMLNVSGWWDQEDFYGPITIYETLEKHDTKNLNYLVSGPWNHGGWAHGTGRTLGPLDFGSDTSAYFRDRVQRPWFAYWLKGEGDGHFPEARTFESGTDKWEAYEHWPPRENVSDRNLYTHSGGKLSFEAPQSNASNAYDSYLSDPANPIPYRHRPIEPTYPFAGWPTWLEQDQRFAQQRPDDVSWEIPALSQDLHVAGDIVVHLYASTTGTDSDWIAKLIDVYPQTYPANSKMAGYELMVANEVFRGRFRKSFVHPSPIPANQVEEYTIDIHTNDHCFLPGHRIMLQIQSTWFPLIDRNPQKFVPNIFKATAADYQAATQHIYRSRRYPTHVTLPVVTP